MSDAKTAAELPDEFIVIHEMGDISVVAYKRRCVDCWFTSVLMNGRWRHLETIRDSSALEVFNTSPVYARVKR